MPFCFYPQHEYGCPNINHCPHLGGAGLGTLVNAAGHQDQYIEMILGQLEAERARNAKLVEENAQLRDQLDQVKLELKVERQNKFATSASKDSEEPEPSATPDARGDVEPKKRGAPVGHPGWFRPTPTEFDQQIDVDAPGRCPHCGGLVHLFPNVDPGEHWQEDVVDGVYQVIVYRHPAARCDDCRNWVRQAGDGELLGSRIGPRLRSWAVYLRHGIGISYRKVPQALEELLGITFTPAALLGFEKILAHLARTARDWQKVVPSESAASTFFTDVKEWVRRGCRFYHQRARGEFSPSQLTDEQRGGACASAVGGVAQDHVRPSLRSGRRTDGTIDDGPGDGQASRPASDGHLLPPAYTPAEPGASVPVCRPIAVRDGAGGTATAGLPLRHHNGDASGWQACRPAWPASS